MNIPHKRPLFTSLITLLIVLSPLSAQQRFGAGVIVGEPTGLSAKYWINELNAVTAGMAWSFEGRTSLQLQADYLWHNYSVFPLAGGAQMPVYYGVGGRVKNKRNANNQWGVRIPFGINYIFQAPWDIFAEVVPIVDFSPSSGLSLNAAVGVRYYF